MVTITKEALDCLNAGRPQPKKTIQKHTATRFKGAKYPIAPVPKPRMTQRDKRLPKRQCVERYHNFKDCVRELGIEIPENGSHIIFLVPMPKSWSKKERAIMLSKPHKQRPDVDNYLKAILDAVYIEDSGVWDIRVSKRWSDEGAIVIMGSES